MPTISCPRRVPWINGFGQTRTVIFIGFKVPKPVYPCHPIVGMIWQNALIPLLHMFVTSSAMICDSCCGDGRNRGWGEEGLIEGRRPERPASLALKNHKHKDIKTRSQETEKVCWHTRKETTHNQYFDTPEALCQSLFSLFDDLQQRPSALVSLSRSFS